MESQGILPVPIFINGVEAHTIVRDQLTSARERESVAAGRVTRDSTYDASAAVDVDAVVNTIGFPLVGGPAGSMEAGRGVAGCGGGGHRTDRRRHGRAALGQAAASSERLRGAGRVRRVGRRRRHAEAVRPAQRAERNKLRTGVVGQEAEPPPWFHRRPRCRVLLGKSLTKIIIIKGRKP